MIQSSVAVSVPTFSLSLWYNGALWVSCADRKTAAFHSRPRHTAERKRSPLSELAPAGCSPHTHSFLDLAECFPPTIFDRILNRLPYFSLSELTRSVSRLPNMSCADCHFFSPVLGFISYCHTFHVSRTCFSSVSVKFLATF